MKSNKKSALEILLEFTEKTRGKTVLAICLAIIGVMFGMLPYYCIARLIGELYLNGIDMSFILRYTVIAILGETIKMICTTFSTKKAHEAAYMILENIRKRIAEKMLKVPMGIMIENTSGYFKSMIVDTVEKLEKPLAHILPEMTANIITPVLTLIILFVLDWRMGIASLISIPIGLICSLGQMRDYKNKSNRYMKANSDMDSSLVEYVNGIQVIKAFNQSTTSFQKFTNTVNYYHDTTIDWWKDSWLFSSLGSTIMPAAIVCVFPYGGYLFMKNEISFAIFITCVILAMGIAGPILQSASFIDSFSVVSASIEQIHDFLETKELIRPDKEVNLTNEGFKVENVTFAYNEGENVIRNVSFEPAIYGMTAIVGPSGGGKSTIAKLLAGFWDVNEGCISYGGVNIKDIPINQLMDKISYVSQDNFLLDVSIKENIKLGNPNATDQEVIDVAKKARCHEFIMNLDKGYDTKAGEAGGKLSGGERQRITIARAMLKSAEVILLDEATAYADPENEAHIQSAIMELVKGKTLIVIAHRLSTIKDADKIVVVENGEIIAEGTQKELLSECPLYEKMWSEHMTVNEEAGA